MDFGTVAPGDPASGTLSQRAAFSMLVDDYVESSQAPVVVSVGPIELDDGELELWRQVVHSVFGAVIERQLPVETASVRAASGPAGSRLEIEVEMRNSLVVPLFDIDRVRLWSLSSTAAELGVAFDATIVDDVLLVTLTGGSGVATIDLVHIEDDRTRGTRRPS